MKFPKITNGHMSAFVGGSFLTGALFSGTPYPQRLWIALIVGSVAAVVLNHDWSDRPQWTQGVAHDGLGQADPYFALRMNDGREAVVAQHDDGVTWNFTITSAEDLCGGIDYTSAEDAKRAAEKTLGY